MGKRKTGAVETWLRELFNQGLTPDGKVDKARKVSARLAAQKMKDMVAAGKFHHEDLLSYTQIQSWFGQEKVRLATQKSAQFPKEPKKKKK